MPTLTITIDLGNAAFGSEGPTCGYETARILRRLGESLELNGVADACPQTLFDSNFNRVGSAKCTEGGDA